MKVLCDVHIARKVVRFFKGKGIDAIHINDILDSWHTKDKKIADYADKEGYTVMSKDNDFKNSHLLKQSPKSLLMISLGNISTSKLIGILEKNLEFLKEKFEAEKSYVEISPNAVIIIVN
ncbi:MAG: DUF5615 family PIN-like protein [Lewinellaceae bacterium]|nr:DUF5615 family PIN-like protein [Lewinellaceae bacterium]